jgi:hypothetical protein
VTVHIVVDAESADTASVLGDILRDTAKAAGHDAHVVVRVVGALTPIEIRAESESVTVAYAPAMAIPSNIGPVLVGVFVMKTGPPKMRKIDSHTLKFRVNYLSRIKQNRRALC